MEHDRVHADDEEQRKEVAEDEEAGLEEFCSLECFKQSVYLEGEIVSLPGVEHTLELDNQHFISRKKFGLRKKE